MIAKNEAEVARSKERRRFGRDQGGGAGNNKGGARILLLLGGGCAALALVIVCAGGGVGIWMWTRAPAEQMHAKRDGDPPKNPDGKGVEPGKDQPPKDQIIVGPKLKNPLKATGPVAAVADTELGPPTDVWNLTIRMPKGLFLRFKDKKDGGTGDASFYDWATPDADEDTPGRACNVLRQRDIDNLGPFLLLTANRKLKSKPGALYPYDTILLPEEVETNGMSGARMWQSLSFPGKSKSTIVIEYRFQADDWSIFLRGVGVGKTEAEARRHAEVVDAAICTLRKR